jgi:hypothetical protein
LRLIKEMIGWLYVHTLIIGFGAVFIEVNKKTTSE